MGIYHLGAFNQEKVLVGAFSVIVQIHQLIVCSTNIHTGRLHGVNCRSRLNTASTTEHIQFHFLCRGKMEMWIEMTDSFLNYFDVKNETEFQQLFNKFLWVVKLEIFVVLASSVWNFNQNLNDAIQSFLFYIYIYMFIYLIYLELPCR